MKEENTDVSCDYVMKWPKTSEQLPPCDGLYLGLWEGEPKIIALFKYMGSNCSVTIPRSTVECDGNILKPIPDYWTFVNGIPGTEKDTIIRSYSLELHPETETVIPLPLELPETKFSVADVGNEDDYRHLLSRLGLKHSPRTTVYDGRTNTGILQTPNGNTVCDLGELYIRTQQFLFTLSALMDKDVCTQSTSSLVADSQTYIVGDPVEYRHNDQYCTYDWEDDGVLPF